jgi:hypothetical protein
MIFISAEFSRSGVFFHAFVNTHPFGVAMNKSGTLIASALLTLGLAAGAMAADAPKSTAPMSADAPAAAMKTADTTKPAKKKHSKKKKTAAPTTTN